MRMLICLLAFAVSVGTPVSADEPLTVYTSRKEHLLRPLFQAYTQATGQEIRYITDDAGVLIQRLRAEGAGTPADLFITVDAGNLWHAGELGLLAPIRSESLDASVPGHLRDPQGRWFGLSVRARTLVYSTERVDASELGGYASLGRPVWDGRLCLRTSKKVYNQSLVAMLMDRDGTEATEETVRTWVDNLAAPPFSNDNAVMDAIVSGQCDVGLVNTYYFGRMQRELEDLPLALYFPSAEEGGVHVNVSGAGVVAGADQAAAARRLLEWLASTEAQALFAGLNLEYPVNPAVAPDPVVAAWGELEPMPGNVARAGALQAAAVMLMDRAGYR